MEDKWWAAEDDTFMALIPNTRMEVRFLILLLSSMSEWISGKSEFSPPLLASIRRVSFHWPKRLNTCTKCGMIKKG